MGIVKLLNGSSSLLCLKVGSRCVRLDFKMHSEPYTDRPTDPSCSTYVPMYQLKINKSHKLPGLPFPLSFPYRLKSPNYIYLLLRDICQKQAITRAVLEVVEVRPLLPLLVRF